MSNNKDPFSFSGNNSNPLKNSGNPSQRDDLVYGKEAHAAKTDPIFHPSNPMEFTPLTTCEDEDNDDDDYTMEIVNDKEREKSSNFVCVSQSAVSSTAASSSSSKIFKSVGVADQQQQQYTSVADVQKLSASRKYTPPPSSTLSAISSSSTSAAHELLRFIPDTRSMSTQERTLMMVDKTMMMVENRVERKTKVGGGMKELENTHNCKAPPPSLAPTHFHHSESDYAEIIDKIATKLSTLRYVYYTYHPDHHLIKCRYCKHANLRDFFITIYFLEKGDEQNHSAMSLSSASLIVSCYIIEVRKVYGEGIIYDDPDSDLYTIIKEIFLPPSPLPSPQDALIVNSKKKRSAYLMPAPHQRQAMMGSQRNIFAEAMQFNQQQSQNPVVFTAELFTQTSNQLKDYFKQQAITWNATMTLPDVVDDDDDDVDDDGQGKSLIAGRESSNSSSTSSRQATNGDENQWTDEEYFKNLQSLTSLAKDSYLENRLEGVKGLIDFISGKIDPDVDWSTADTNNNRTNNGRIINYDCQEELLSTLTSLLETDPDRWEIVNFVLIAVCLLIDRYYPYKQVIMDSNGYPFFRKMMKVLTANNSMNNTANTATDIYKVGGARRYIASSLRKLAPREIRSSKLSPDSVVQTSSYHDLIVYITEGIAEQLLIATGKHNVGMRSFNPNYIVKDWLANEVDPFVIEEMKFLQLED